jgi:hypothetical protein
LCISELAIELKMMQGWSMSCTAGAHKNRIVLHQMTHSQLLKGLKCEPK